MDNNGLIASIVSSIAWPLTLLAVAFIFKKPLTSVLNNIRTFRYKDAQLDLSSDLDSIPRDRYETPERKISITENQIKLAELSPRGAILEAWIELESLIKETAAKEGIAISQPAGLRGNIVDLDSFTLAQQLLLGGKFSEENFKKFQKLKNVRNKAVHATDFQISAENAETFIRLISEIKFDLEN